LYSECRFCPRDCGADRLTGKHGYCRSGITFNVGSVCLHNGEEPVLGDGRGVCNVFFTRCNLQCIYCQNYQISRNKTPEIEYSLSFDGIINKIVSILDAGCNTVGFVSPTHFIPNVITIIEELWRIGSKPVFVYNSNGYDKVETLKILEPYIDIYLPDFKYIDSELSGKLSDAPDYPEVAIKAIKEMHRQKGSDLILNDDEQAVSGLIIRHLILPGQVENSLKVLRIIANEISPEIHISLMSQYQPIEAVKDMPDLKRTITQQEYETVIEELDRLGFENGWVQEYGSNESYTPDFREEMPFE
jgi:putative pyruvate formate lyase activating enzyme